MKGRVNMYLLSVFLFAISANIDNFTVGIAYGIKKIQIGLFNNFLIALISAVGTFLSMHVGLTLSKFMSVSTANSIGSSVLILIGIWAVKDSVVNQLKKHKKGRVSHTNCKRILDEPELADRDNSKTLDVKESAALAFALTINNLGLGIGASITGFNIYITVLFTFIFSILSITLGSMLGKTYMSKLFGKFAPLISGIIIVALGVYEFFY